MAVTFTQTKALLQTMATTLSAESTIAGLTTMATGLTDLATEISQSVTESEFFGGGTTSYTGTSGGTGTDYDSAALVWSQTLISAANIIQSRNSNFIKASISAIETDIDTMTSNSTTIKDKQTIIADKQTTIADKQTTIADKQTTIADKQTAMETYQKKMKELGEGPGIHFIGPYEVFGLVSIYRMMIEQAKILESAGTPAAAEQVAQALIEVRRLSELIKSNISKDF